MKQETIERLLALNQTFYERSAQAFSASRGAPWSGWARLLDRFSSPLTVLDLGCGNGRFLAELSRRNLVRDYVGVDTSRALLEVAKRAHPKYSAPNVRDQRIFRGAVRERSESGAITGPSEYSERESRAEKRPGLEGSCTKARFEQADALELSAGTFELVVAFGLLHHLPSFALRERFAASLRTHLAHGGLACITFWRFEELPRFQKRMLPWSIENDREPGDHLLAFGDEGPRYCHHASDDEIGRLVEATGLLEIDRWSADGETGDLNLYSVLEESERW